MCPDELRVQGQYLFQLDDSQILAVLITIDQCLIVFLDGLVNGIQAGRIGLQHIDVIVLIWQLPSAWKDFCGLLCYKV